MVYLTLSLLFPVLAAFIPDPHILARTIISITKFICNRKVNAYQILLEDKHLYRQFILEVLGREFKLYTNSTFKRVEDYYRYDQQRWSHKRPNYTIFY